MNSSTSFPSGSFLSRLDNAVAEGKEEARDLSPVLRESGSNLLQRASEYIFDIFDANCMEEYHIINNFEDRAMKAFPYEDIEKDEITFEQDRLHNEFLVIFEGLLERFVTSENISIAEFYDQVRSHYHGGRRMAHAMEVVDVIFCYTDISQWAAMMKENSRQRRGWEDQRTALQEAAERSIQGLPKKNAERHRLDEK